MDRPGTALEKMRHRVLASIVRRDIWFFARCAISNILPTAIGERRIALVRGIQ